MISLTSSISDVLRDPHVAEAAARGQVHVISAKAIRSALGPRWFRQQPLVEEFVIRAFSRGGLEDDLIHPVNEADFFLVQPSRGGAAALVRASQVMRETLRHFLGEAKAENVHVAIVNSLAAGRIEATAIIPPADPDEDVAPPAAAQPPADPDLASPPWEACPATGRAQPRVEYIESPGAERLKLSLFIQPVWNVRAGAVASFLVEALVFEVRAGDEIVPAELQDLAPRALGEIGLRALRFAQDLWRSAGDVAPALHVALPFGGLTHSTPRTALISELRRIRDEQAGRPLVVEITGAPSALPASAVEAIIGQLRPFVRGVALRFADPADAERWIGTGACGLIWDPPGGGPASQTALVRAITTVGRTPIAIGFHGVARPPDLLCAWAHGATHLSGDAISRAYGEDFTARRFDISEFYGLGR